MSRIEAANQEALFTCPVATAGAVLAVTSSAGSQNLALIGNQTQNIATQATASTGVQGHFISLQADGEDMYVTFGATQAAVTSANAPVIATTGVNTAGICYLIPKGTTVRFFARAGLDLWIGYIAASTGNLRIWQSSY
jgi:hypothetical protein